MKYSWLLCDYKCLLLFLFILNLIDNGVWLFIQPTVLSAILVIVLSALFAVLEVLFFRIILTTLLKVVYAIILIILHVERHEKTLPCFDRSYYITPGWVKQYQFN